MDAFWWIWATASLIILCGSVLQGVVGYGISLFSAPLLYQIEPNLVPGVLILLGGVLPVLVFWDNRRHVHYPDLLYALPASALGVGSAFMIAGLLSDSGWQIVFGALIVLAVILSSLQRSTKGTSHGKTALGSYGAGLMGTITGIGGPPVALAFKDANPDRLRGTLSAIFVPTSVFAAIALIGLGRFGVYHITWAAYLAPAMLAGFWLSRHLARRLSHRFCQVLLLSVAAVAGSYTLWQGLTGVMG